MNSSYKNDEIGKMPWAKTAAIHTGEKTEKALLIRAASIKKKMYNNMYTIIMAGKIFVHRMRYFIIIENKSA